MPRQKGAVHFGRTAHIPFEVEQGQVDSARGILRVRVRVGIHVVRVRLRKFLVNYLMYVCMYVGEVVAEG